MEEYFQEINHVLDTVTYRNMILYISIFGLWEKDAHEIRVAMDLKKISDKQQKEYEKLIAKLGIPHRTCISVTYINKIPEYDIFKLKYRDNYESAYYYKGKNNITITFFRKVGLYFF